MIEGFHREEKATRYVSRFDILHRTTHARYVITNETFFAVIWDMKFRNQQQITHSKSLRDDESVSLTLTRFPKRDVIWNRVNIEGRNEERREKRGLFPTN